MVQPLILYEQYLSSLLLFFPHQLSNFNVVTTEMHKNHSILNVF